MTANSCGITWVNCNTYSGAEIGLFCASSNLTFQGLVQFKVIAGLVTLYGHTFQPATIFHDACPLQTQLEMTAVSVDEVTVLKQKDYAVAINSVPLVFRQARHVETLGKAVLDLSGEDCTRPLLYVEVELNQTDCRRINDYIEKDLAQNVCAIVVFRELRSNAVEILFRCFAFYSHGKKTSLSGASKRFVKGGTSKKSLEIPNSVEKAISELADEKDLTLMIVGQANTGKSTLARYAVNSLLNWHKRVAFLECDVGQTEFTPSGVVSMAFVTQPLIGPPSTHQRAPERAYFIGDSSPMQQPDLYVCSINSLMEYFISRKEPMPLVVNTCGWLRDLGTCIFWDLLRLISPTHVIHLHGDQESGFQSYWFREELVPINAFKNCHHSPGWLLTLPNSFNQPHPPGSDNQHHPSSSCDHPYPQSSNNQPHPLIGESSHVRQAEIELPETTRPSTSTETVPATAISGTSEWASRAKEGSKRTLTSTSRKLKLKRLLNKKKKTVKVAQPSLSKGKAVSRKFLHRMKLRDDLLRGTYRTRRRTHKRIDKVTHDTSWKCCGVFQFFSHLINPYSTQTSSKTLREIAMALYFTRLNNETSTIIPWPELILAATPYEISWNQLAVHCLTVEVPRSQILHAINGMIVGLTRVDPSIIIDFDNSHHGMVKFLNERTPMTEYIGYGLVRGVDMTEKLFYITTPEPLHRLEQVNCLMLGKNELPSNIYTCSKKHCSDATQPYIGSNLPKMAITKPFRGRPI